MNKDSQSPEKHSSRETELTFRMRRIGAVVLIVVSLAAIELGVNRLNEPRQIIDSTTFSVPYGEELETSAKLVIEQIAINNNIDPTKISNPDIVYKCQTAQKEIGGITHPEDSFTATLVKNNNIFSNTTYGVEIEPIIDSPEPTK